MKTFPSKYASEAKVICAMMVFLASSLAVSWAGSGGYESSGVSYSSEARIPANIMQAIKNRAAYDFPGRPADQVRAVTRGFEDYFAWLEVRNSPVKRQAALEFPFNFPKQLYLSQRGYLKLQSTGGSAPTYW